MFDESKRFRLRIHLHRPGCPQETLDHYYVVGRKPAGGMTVRVLFPDDFTLEENDCLIFDFTTEPYQECPCDTLPTT
jgi:hypothetical protein